MFISIPKKAFVDGHKKHGDKIVADKYCEKDKKEHAKKKR